MSSNQLQNNNGHGFNHFQDSDFLSPLPPPDSVSVTMRGEREGTQMGLDIFGPQSIKSWSFPPLMTRELKRTGDQASNGSFGFGIKGLSLNQAGEEDEQKGVSSNKNGRPELCARGHWRPAEDAKLKELVAQFGPQNWNLIAAKLEGRSGKSCRLRWFNQLDPRINRRPFTEEEEEMLLAAHRAYGNKWAMISRLFSARTDNAVKNHWHVIMARKHREKCCVYRKGKPSSSSSSSSSSSLHSFILTDCHNDNKTSGELSKSSCTLDESASASNDHPLSISFHWVSALFNPVQQHHSYASQTDSNSEVLFVANNGGNEEDGNVRALNLNLPFFDFLGVGAT
ncbi:hypothetical protein Nepgr_028538 [Nepenthes gracilis]|uniref:Uncharacterized protein n=1 Tax=Nepenthes gracilis TaxID=150966 RepID=A0AAD3TBW1_NEPGR|nr:hypothetical protein Nepgr_028538 [Nepenthes gracilis]